MKRTIFLLLLLLNGWTCLYAQNSSSRAKSLYGNIDKPLYPFYIQISQSPKIKKIDKWIYNHNDEHPHLSYLQKEAPSKSSKYYWLQAGIDGSIRYEPVLNFFVDVKSKRIFYYDPIEDKKIPFKQWEKQPDDYK